MWPNRKWPKHRSYVSSFPCQVTRCPNKAECCHLRTAANSGTGLKPHDWFTVPLCREHHLEQEGRTESFCQKYRVNLWAIASILAHQSPDLAMRAAMREAEERFPWLKNHSYTANGGG